MDDTLSSYTLKGKRQWTVRLPDTITCVEVLLFQPRSFRAVLVALKNREVRIYKDKFLVNCIKMEVRELLLIFQHCVYVMTVVNDSFRRMWW